MHIIVAGQLYITDFKFFWPWITLTENSILYNLFVLLSLQ